MESKGTELDDIDEEDEEEEAEDADLFNNRRRQSMSSEGARRTSLGLPDNGAGLTKDYYNIERPMSVTSLVDLIVQRRTGTQNTTRRRSTQLSEDLEARIKKTLAWKEMEDELNKEDIMVNFRKRMRELRKEARQSIPKESKIERKINEERRIQLRTSLLEPNTRRKSTTESIKEAIQEFRMRQPAIIEEPQVLKNYEDDKETSDIVQKTRELLEQLGYLKQRNINQENEESDISSETMEKLVSTSFHPPPTSSSSHSEHGSRKRKRRISLSSSEKSLSEDGRPRVRTSSVSKSKSYKPPTPKSRKEERTRHEVIAAPVTTNNNILPSSHKEEWEYPKNRPASRPRTSSSVGQRTHRKSSVSNAPPNLRNSYPSTPSGPRASINRTPTTPRRSDVRPSAVRPMPGRPSDSPRKTSMTKSKPIPQRS